MTVRILKGDCRTILRGLPDESVHCVVTSPPYWGLRDYGVDGQIGLEPTTADFVAELVDVFEEVRRVLRADGTLWLNLGDSYAGGRGGNPTEETSTLQGGQDSQRASMIRRVRGAEEIGASARDAAVTNVGRRATRGGAPSSKSTLRGNGHIGGGPKLQRLAPVVGSQLPAGFHEQARQEGAIGRAWVPPPAGLKQKDLVGTPWMVAFALRAAGWWLRQDIIWSKPNPMPESVTDRCTKAHEYLFLLSKSERYFYDSKAVAEARSQDEDSSTFRGGCYVQGEVGNAVMGKRRVPGNKSHKQTAAYEAGDKRLHTKAGLVDYSQRERDADPTDFGTRNKRSVWTIATAPFTEAHFATFPPALIEPCILAGCPAGGVVLDPFGGAGTTGMVADRLGRDAILIELNPDYAAMAERRIKGDAGMFASVTAE